MLSKGKNINVYDFSGGVNLSQPANLIADDECFCDSYNLEGTVNVLWDIGFTKRRGTLKANAIALTESLRYGIRFYRSVVPQKTTIVFADIGTEIKIYYLDDTNVFQEITGGSAIATGSKISAEVWKDKLYIASGAQLVQVISNTGLAWARADITGLTHKPGRIRLHKDRLWVSGGDMPEGYLECCDYDDDTDWSGGDGFAFNVGLKDGDQIIAQKGLGDNLMIYKYNTIWKMEGDNLENWFQKKAQKSVGCAAENSLVDVGIGHIFLGKDNVYFFDGTEIIPIGNKIKPLIDMIPEGLKYLTCATYYNNYYRLSIPSYTDTETNSIELLLDMRYFKSGKISWWIFTGRNIASYIPYNGADDAYSLYACDGSGGYLQQLDKGATDNGVNIVAECQCKYLTFDSPNTDKSYERVIIDSGRGIGDLNLEIYKNVENDYMLPVTINTLSGVVTFGNAVLGESMARSSTAGRLKTEIPLPSECDGRSLSIKIRHSGSESDVTYYGFTLVYKYLRN